MSGILDNKSRVIDAVLTYEGRRQMAEGTFSINYATFSDNFVSYQRNDEEGHEDPTNKIYLQAFNAPQDQITFEADDSGNLVAFRQHSSINPDSNSWTSFLNGKIKRRSLSGSFSEEPVYGADFASQIEGIFTSSIDNFKKLSIIGTSDSLFEDYNFAVSPNEVTFTIKNNSETIQMIPPTDVNTIDALFSDEKLRNVDNFKYLPPIKKQSFFIKNANEQDVTINQDTLLGLYPPWGPTKKLTFSDINKMLQPYEEFSKTVYFDPTSRNNDIVAQFFEINDGSAKKLDVIDYGKISNDSLNPKALRQHVFFVGKVLVDDAGSDCFVHLFTLVFSANEETQ